MSAPSSAYSSKNLQVYKNGSVVYHNIALPNSDIGTLKSRFYLDYMLQTQVGFIGGCIVGSDNYNHHSTARNGIVNLYKSGTVKIMNDGGLNTMSGVINQVVVTSEIENYIVTGTFKSSYYNGNTGVGVRYRISYNNDGIYGDWHDTGVASAVYSNDTTFNYSIKLNDVSWFNVRLNSMIQFFCYAVNEEGTYVSNVSQSSKVTLIARTFKNANDTDVVYYTNNLQDYTSSSQVGVTPNQTTRLWRDNQGVGTFKGTLFSYSINGTRIIYTYDEGGVGAPENNAPNALVDIRYIYPENSSYTAITYMNYNVTQEGACPTNPKLNSPRTIYNRQDPTGYETPDTNKFYTSSTGQTFAPDGYYVARSDVGNQVLHLVNGVMTNTGFICTV